MQPWQERSESLRQSVSSAKKKKKYRNSSTQKISAGQEALCTSSIEQSMNSTSLLR
jgi:hypothetical protein